MASVREHVDVLREENLIALAGGSSRRQRHLSLRGQPCNCYFTATIAVVLNLRLQEHRLRLVLMAL
jgi:hypothetical protein